MPEPDPDEPILTDPVAETDHDTSHRGAFGEFGGSGDGLIDRSFRERIIIVGLTRDDGDPEQTELDLDELALLVDTAGADVVGRITQRRAQPDPALFLGRGKARELEELTEAVDCDTVVFDDDLSPAQQRNLEKLLGCTALDRTAVILDIFAQNAASVEGRAQVELAQLRYLKPRLRGRGITLSQQAGGMSAGGARVGSRGPGETQLETDRRRIDRRIHKLESELRAMAAIQDTQHKRRSSGRAANVAIVGYTNAGKSTLLNRLSGAGVLVEDRLFATLDPTTRRLALPGGEAVLLSDTVGFVRKLPHQLVESFKSTLRVAADADLLIHVVDAAGPDPESHMDAVREVLTEIGAGDVPELLCFNKADADPTEADRLRRRHPGSVTISAATGQGIDDLLAATADRLREDMAVVELLVPYDRGDVLAEIHREGEIIESDPADGGMAVTARLDEVALARLSSFTVD